MTRLGGDAPTRELQDVLELQWEQAEKAKLDASGAMTSGAELDADDERVRVPKSGVQRGITSSVTLWTSSEASTTTWR